MDALMIGPAVALTFAGTLIAGKALLWVFLNALEHRNRHPRY